MRVHKQALDIGIVLNRPDAGDRPIPLVGWNRIQQRIQPLTRLSAEACRQPSKYPGRRWGDELLTFRSGFLQTQGARNRGRLFGREPDSDGRACGLGLAGGLVVEVPDDGVEGITANTAHLPLRRHGGTHTRNIRTETCTTGLVHVLRILAILGILVVLGLHVVRVFNQHVVDNRPTRPRRTGADHHPRRNVEEASHDVMSRRVVTRSNLRRLDPNLFVERELRKQVEVRRFAVGIDLPLDRELIYEVGFPSRRMAPARLGEPGRLRSRAVTLGHASVDPLDDRGDLFVAQADVV